MTNCQYDAEDGDGTLTFAGEMTIGHVNEIKTRLVEAFSEVERVTVDVSAVTAVDVAGIQLLCACHRFSSGRGKQMCLRVGENRIFMDFLEEVGFARDFICGHGSASACLWSA